MGNYGMRYIILAILSWGSVQASDWQPVDSNCKGSYWEDRFSLYASLLYWKTYGDELDYSVQRSFYSNSETVDQFHDMKGSFDYGFRVGGELELDCPGWGIDLEWTHYNNNSSHRKTLDQPNNSTSSIVAIPWVIYSENTFEDPEEKALFRSKMRYHYDTIDLDVARWFCRKEGFSFRPFFGFRVARFEERFSSEYVMNVSGNAAKAEAKNLFKGYGLRAGLDTEWNIPCNFTLFAKAAGSIIWGKTKLKHDDVLFSFEDTSYITNDLRETSREGRYIAELALGIRWVGEICSFYPLFFELSFDQTYLFDQHRFFTVAMDGVTPTLQTKKNGDLLLQGASLTVGLEF